MLERIVGAIVVGGFWLMLGSAGFAAFLAVVTVGEGRCASGQTRVIVWGEDRYGTPQRKGQECRPHAMPDQVWANNERGQPVRIK